MALFWTKSQLDAFGMRVKDATEKALAKRGTGELAGTVAQSGQNLNPSVSLETKHGTRSFTIAFAHENLEATDEELEEKIGRELDRIL